MEMKGVPNVYFQIKEARVPLYFDYTSRYESWPGDNQT